jgi:hypothetical protein
MILFNKNILGFSRLFLMLFFLANAGFTVVLYHCTMTEEMCGMSCCVGINDCAAGTCQDMDRSQTPETKFVKVDRPCQTATVVGGVQNEPKVVEKQFNSRQIISIDLLPSSVFEAAIGPRVDLPVFHFTSTASNFSPPSVETYVLNASFLI